MMEFWEGEQLSLLNWLDHERPAAARFTAAAMTPSQIWTD